MAACGRWARQILPSILPKCSNCQSAATLTSQTSLFSLRSIRSIASAATSLLSPGLNPLSTKIPMARCLHTKPNSMEVCGKAKCSELGFYNRGVKSHFTSQRKGPILCRAADNNWFSVKAFQTMSEVTDCHSIPKRTFSSAQESVIKAKVRGIQKDISPLTTKRVVRRKRTKDSPPREQEVFDVTAYATAEEYDLESLKKQLAVQGLYGVLPLPDDVPDAIHVEARYRLDDEPREIFFFREGSVVFWNIPEVEKDAVIRFLKRHQLGSYDMRLVRLEFEHVEFAYTTKATQLVGDEIQFQRPEEGAEYDKQHQLEKYAFSNALSLSVKLAIWEASLAKYVDSVEWVLQDLKDGKKIKFSESDILRKSGELFTLRHLINLSSDLLDTPDFYWDRENLEHLYSRTLSYLYVTRRTKVMNDKLTHCCDLTELLRDHLKDIHHTRLEWMIILLIMIEVAFEILHTYERHMGRDEKQAKAARN